jgi:hypothetical protein
MRETETSERRVINPFAVPVPIGAEFLTICATNDNADPEMPLNPDTNDNVGPAML